MLYRETVGSGTLDLIRRLMQEDALMEFILVGGTALSLQIGHRKSEDIDLFSKNAFDSDMIAKELERKCNAEINRVL